MNKLLKRIPTKTWKVYFLCFILIPGVLFWSSCTSKKKYEELNKQFQASQAKVEELQKDVAARETTINQLKKENAVLLSQIPESYEVQKGDDYWRLSYNYLTQKKGVPADAAKKILADTAFFSPMRVGFKVWHYYYGNIYGTFVTQGNAKVSPGALTRVEKRKITEEKAKIEQQIEELKKKAEQPPEQAVVQIKSFEKENEELKAQLETLKKQVADLEGKYSELESRLNSVYYFVDTKGNLKAKGKVRGTFLGLFGLKVGEIYSSDFQNRLDLREGNVIELKAADFQGTSIKKVKLLPKHIDEGLDYRVEIAGDRQSAEVHLLKKDKFLLSQIILIVN